MSRQENEAFEAAVKQNAEKRKAEMKAIFLFIQMNLVQLCQEKVALDDAMALPRDAKILTVAERLTKIINPAQAHTLAYRMVADEAVRQMARRSAE